jgi:hypothetical protein
MKDLIAFAKTGAIGPRDDQPSIFKAEQPFAHIVTQRNADGRATLINLETDVVRHFRKRNNGDAA